MVYVKRHAVPRPDSRPDHHLRLALHIKSFGPPSSTESAQAGISIVFAIVLLVFIHFSV